MSAEAWIAAIGALAALVAAGVPVYLHRRRPALKVNVSRTRAPAQGADLTVLSTDTPEGSFGQTPPTIDVRLLNTGTGTAVIVGCEVVVHWARSFTRLDRPVVRIDRSGAAILPPSAHYTAVLPDPKEATGLQISGRRDEPNPLREVLFPTDSEGLGPAHELPAGKADRFTIRLEAEPHRDGTPFGHPHRGDDQLAYIVQLVLRYDGSRTTRTISTGKIGVVCPANTFILPRASDVAEVVSKFRQEVRDMECSINSDLTDAGVRAVDWQKLREARDGLNLAVDPRTDDEIEAFQSTMDRHGPLNHDFFYPDSAVQDYLDRCDQLYGDVIDEVPPDSDLAGLLHRVARQERAALAQYRANQEN